MRYFLFNQGFIAREWRLSTHLMLLLALIVVPFSSNVLAATPPIVINTPDTSLASFPMAYFIDRTGDVTLEHVQKRHFTPSRNYLTLGAKAKIVWVKIRLKNPTNEPMPLYLHYPPAYHNLGLTLYEVDNGKLLNSRTLDLDDSHTYQWMYRGLAIFDLTLPAHSQRTFYLKSTTYLHQWFNIELYGPDQSKRAIQNINTDINVLIGMLLALMIYNLLMFVSSRRREHLFYAMYLLFGGIWLSLTYGLIANLFGTYGFFTRYINLSLGGMPIFLLLFMMEIFETKLSYPREHFALKLVSTLLCLNMIYGLFNISHAIDLSTYLAALMMLVSLSVTLSLLRKRHVLAKYFLLGHGLFILFGNIAVLFYEGLVDYNYVTSHGVGIGMLLEAIVLALIISYRLRVLEKLQNAQDELQYLASTDPLTQLLNRRQFKIEAHNALAAATQKNRPLSVVILDIDHFKVVNDTYGHAVGDQLIVHIADLLKLHFSALDTISRFGGEEFVVLMPDTSIKAAFLKVENVRKRVEMSPAINEAGTQISMTISAGVSSVELRSNSIETAISQADKALYLAKNNGRNQVNVFQHRLRELGPDKTVFAQ